MNQARLAAGIFKKYEFMRVYYDSVHVYALAHTQTYYQRHTFRDALRSIRLSYHTVHDQAMLVYIV